MSDVDLGLEVGRLYSAQELGEHFGFRPYYLRTAGGMVSAPRRGALLLITHSNEDASFEYGDYWDGDDLVYTGRGQSGDQVLAGQNRDVAENRRALLLFAHHERYQRLYLGRATCTNHWWSPAHDKNGAPRKVLRFCLRLGASGATSSIPSRSPLHRRPRQFNEAPPSAPAPGASALTPDEVARLMEKAVSAHHSLLLALKRCLETNGWTDVQEIPAAVDLWAQHGPVKVIFEAKTITPRTELTRTRAAISQLLEYRYFYGAATDRLCLVCNEPLSDRRLRLLAALGIDVLWHDGKRFVACSEGASHWPVGGPA